MTACATVLLLAGASCSEDNTLLSDSEETATTKAVIREILTVETDTVGQLANKIGYNSETVQKLIVSGPINAMDVQTIRDLPELLSLDLKDATIYGGESTYTIGNSTYELYDNIIGEYMFYDTNLSEIVLPDNIVGIGSHAFYGLSGTTENPFSEIEIPEGVSTIGEYAFGNCSNLTTVKLPSTLCEVPYATFSYCEKLTAITIPESVTSIGMHCFNECTSLSDITLPESLVSIGSEAFYGCTSLTTITIPQNVTSVGIDIFYRCQNLTSIFWNTDVTVPRLFSAYDNSSVFIKNPYCLLYLADASTNVNDYDIRNIIKNGVADEIVLSSEMGNFNVPQEFKANRLTYTREFTYPTYPGEAAGWRSISLPFTVQTITGPEDQTLAPFNADVDDAKPFWLRRLTADGFEDVTTIEAGVPYIIAMPNNRAYKDEYNIIGTVTFMAEDITVPATGSDNMVQDVGPEYVFNCNYNYHTANAVVWALNESTANGYVAGSVFVRNERAVMPFEGYVSSSAVTTGNAPYLFRIDTNTVSTRSDRPLGPVPSIDDM